MERHVIQFGGQLGQLFEQVSAMQKLAISVVGMYVVFQFSIQVCAFYVDVS